MSSYSILMSVYHKDNPEYLKTAIESMLNQTVLSSQFVIVEDGRLPEDLETVIQNYESNKGNLFTIVRYEKNAGLGHALNEGLKYCTNELIARMDADDISLPTRCEEELKCFENDPELAIVGSLINEFFDNPDNIVSRRVVPEVFDEIKRFARRRSPFNHPTVMFKKQAVQKCGGYPELMRKEDLRLFPIMVNNGCKAYNIQKPLLLYRSNNENYLRRKTWTNCSEYIFVIKQNYKDGYSNLFDLIYVFFGQMILFIMPKKIMKKVSNNLLRERPIQ